MRSDLQKKIFEAGPVLYGARRISSVAKQSWNIDCPDDLFEFLLELTTLIEAHNRRRKKGYVRAMKVGMEEGKLVFITQKRIPCVEKMIGQTRLKIRRYRAPLRQALLTRARNIQSTALFASRLIPDWKHFMPDELLTLKKILRYAERNAVNRGDWKLLSRWFTVLLKDTAHAELCAKNADAEQS